MNDKLAWATKGFTFVDGSCLGDWEKIYQSPEWHWQYDTHEMTFAIYLHDGQYWKLYQVRYLEPGDKEYRYDFGGVACRMVLVEYRTKTSSPHSNTLKNQDEQEWIRTYEYDPHIHKVIKAGEANDKYGEPYEVSRNKVA